MADIRYVDVPHSGVCMGEAPRRRVALSKAPWDKPVSLISMRPETDPRRSLVQQPKRVHPRTAMVMAAIREMAQ